MTYLLILSIVWLAAELSLVARDRAQGRGKTAQDRGTRSYNLLSIIISMFLAIFFAQNTNITFMRRSSDLFLWLGALLVVGGIAVRLWAVLTLGRSFRTTIETQPGQGVVQAGPYRLVRHPSYSGALLICLGFGIAFQNWLSLLVLVALPLAAVLHRIPIEEAALVQGLGQAYVEYQQRTKKLVPFVW
jgi:protein-S-isoprenylcysteine O-methyltransferase Ste14